MVFIKAKKHLPFLLVILLFSLSVWIWFLSISLLRDNYKTNYPEKWKNEVANNSEANTSFAVHIEPYAIFSEDFHLYILRAKRFIENGFIDNILEPSSAEFKLLPANYIQAFLHAIPALTGNNIIYYGFFIAGMLFLVYSLLYIYIDKIIENRFISLTAVLFIFVSFSRILRISTYFYSIPLLILILLYSSKVVRNKEIKTSNLLVISISCLLISGIDFWGFLISCLIIFYTLCFLFRNYLINKDANIKSLKATGTLCLIQIAIFALFLMTSYSPESDLKIRAGIGELYKNSVGNYFSYYYQYSFQEAYSLLLAIFGPLLILIKPIRKKLQEFLEKVFKSKKESAQIIFIGILLLNLSALCALFLFYIFGINVYQSTHLIQFSGKITQLFLTVLFLMACWEFTFLKATLKKTFLIGLIGLLAIAYQIKLYRLTVFNEKYLEFGIPTYYEEAIHFLKNEKNPEKKIVLTLSHELNYLLAYHTNFNLSLPEGFTLHSTYSNEAIYSRMNYISSFLTIDGEQWKNFMLNEHPFSQLSWKTDRVMAARQDYSYYLFHRGYIIGYKTDYENHKDKESLSKKMIEYINNFKNKEKNIRPTYIVVEPVSKSFTITIPKDYELIKNISNGTVLIYKKVN